MIDTPHKLHLTDITGNQYIRYELKKAVLFVQIFEKETPEEAARLWTDLAGWHQVKEKTFLASRTEFKNRHFLFVVTNIGLKTEVPEKYFRALTFRMDKLADWYKYTYLIPLSKGQPPIITSAKAEKANAIRRQQIN